MDKTKIPTKSSAKICNRQEKGNEMTSRIDLQFVTPRIALGSSPRTQQDSEKLLSSGITPVLDCRLGYKEGGNESMYEEAIHSDLDYFHNGTLDDGEAKAAQWFEKGIDYAHDVLGKTNTKLYVHCQSGVERAPSMVYAILQTFGYSSEESEMLIRKARPYVLLGYQKDADNAIQSLEF
jgi:hypothetical protein